MSGYPLDSFEIFKRSEWISLIIADRTSEAVTPLLESHPEIQVVSRDRANGFAEAISQALPHATQVADRYHLIQNLRDHLQQFLDRKRACLPLVKDTPVDAKEGSPDGMGTPPPDRAPASPAADLSNMIAADRKKLISRNKRLARYEEVMALYHEGVSQRDIARQLHLSRNTVQYYVSSPDFPERIEGTGRRNPRTSKLDRYLPYIRDLWDAGNHNGAHLFRLIKARGYTGCESMLRMKLPEWRTELPKQTWPVRPPPAPAGSVVNLHHDHAEKTSKHRCFLLPFPLILPEDGFMCVLPDM